MLSLRGRMHSVALYCRCYILIGVVVRLSINPLGFVELGTHLKDMCDHFVEQCRLQVRKPVIRLSQPQGITYRYGRDSGTMVVQLWSFRFSMVDIQAGSGLGLELSRFICMFVE